MKLKIDYDTELSLINKYALCQINDILDENMLLFSSNFESILHNPNNKWKQNRVDEAIIIFNKYKKQISVIYFYLFLDNVYYRKKNNQQEAKYYWNLSNGIIPEDVKCLFEIEWNRYLKKEHNSKEFELEVNKIKPYFKDVWNLIIK